jgi:hypothetical protein
MASPRIHHQGKSSELACPYFMPVAKLENGNWPHPPRLPLGCGWSGHCTAPGHEQAVPSQDVLETFCNLGYASSCDWAPAERRCDAVRFAVAAPAKSSRESNPVRGENAPSRILRLSYVYEQGNRPAGQGELEFDLATTSWLRRHEDVRIQKMAECFLEAYLRKRS